MPGPKMIEAGIKTGRRINNDVSGQILRPGDKSYHGRLLGLTKDKTEANDVRRQWDKAMKTREELKKPDWEDKFDERTTNGFLALAGGTAAASTGGGLLLRRKLNRENAQLRARRVKKDWSRADPGMWHAPKEGGAHRVTLMGEKNKPLRPKRSWRAKLGRELLEQTPRGQAITVAGLTAAVAPLVMIPHKQIQENTRLRTGHGSVRKSARLDALSRIPGFTRRNGRDAALPAGLLAVGTGSATVHSRRQHESGRRTTGSALSTLAAGGAGEAAWRGTGMTIRRKGNALVRTERPGQTKSQRKKAESEWRHKYGISGSSSSDARRNLQQNYRAMRNYPKSNAAAPYKRALGQMSGKRGLAMEAVAVGAPMLAARRFTQRKQVAKNGPRDPQAAYASAKAKGYPHDFDTFMSRFGAKSESHGVKTRAPKAAVKAGFKLPRSWTTSALGAGATVGAVHHLATHPARTPQQRHTNEAIGAGAGAAGANVGYQMGGKATKIGIQRYRNPRMTPEHNKTWQSHLQSHGIHSANQLGDMGFEARRKVYAHYPLSIPGGRAQRLLAFKNKRSVGVATSVAGAALGARLAGRKQPTAKRYDSRDVRARKMRRNDKVQLGLGATEAGASLAGLKGRHVPLRLLFAAPGLAAAGQAAYDLRQDEYGWSPAERARRGAGRVQMVGKSREYGYLQRKRSAARTTEMVAGLGLLGYGVPRLRMLGPAAAKGIKTADKHGAGKEARAALELARAFGSKAREVTGRGETRLRQIKTLDQAITAVPASIRGEVATAAGALMSANAHPTTKDSFQSMGRY